MTDVLTVQNALKAHTPKLHKLRNVVATGVGYKVIRGKQLGEPAIICSVVKKLPAASLAQSDIVPSVIDGVATDVVEVGHIRALSRTVRRRPCPGGMSIGHYAITAGTLGCLVNKDGRQVILSNNHVLANSNAAQIGDAILQPGPVDGGRTNDRIATLLDFIPINFDMPEPPSDCKFARAVIAAFNLGCKAIGSKTRYRVVRPKAAGQNLVDAAIALPLDPAEVVDEILDIGTIQGVAVANLGDTVKKSGRTTGFTTGTILQTDVTVDVSYGAGQVARFTDQLMAGAMSAGGDSGSALLNEHDELVGLLFAGSDSTTIFNHIDNVFLELGVTR